MLKEKLKSTCWNLLKLVIAWWIKTERLLHALTFRTSLVRNSNVIKFEFVLKWMKVSRNWTLLVKKIILNVQPRAELHWEWTNVASTLPAHLPLFYEEILNIECKWQLQNERQVFGKKNFGRILPITSKPLLYKMIDIIC